jgi:uncharacterized RDD family membrane protein YckC
MASNDSSAPAAERLGAVLAREPAGLVRRALATAIDHAFALLVGYGARAALSAFAAHDSGEPELVAWISNHPRLAWSLTSALPAWLALSIAEALPGRAGPGKRALGLCVEGPHPQQSPSFARIALRTAIKLVPWLIAALAFLFPKPWDPREALERTRFFLLLGSNLWIGIYLASAAMTRRRQSVHDLATGTVVLKVRSH